MVYDFSRDGNGSSERPHHKRKNPNQRPNAEKDLYSINGRKEFNLTKGNSEWEGWGTALKPALEPITVARKPIEQNTIAENVLKWGTGGLNIDECRVGFESGEYISPRDKRGTNHGFKDHRDSIRDDVWVMPKQGRFPANFIHDGSDEVVNSFPNVKPHGQPARNSTAGGCFGGNSKAVLPNLNQYLDSGSAARFFYCAKASKSERNAGCEALEEKQARTTYDKSVRENNGNDSGYQRANHHPTVKPIALMQYLIKLVSRENALILDPFLGSGSTGIAAKNLKRDFIGIELDPEYFAIAQARINSAKDYSENDGDDAQLGLF
jgi:site-specific DNA-methyltransferase (adenine-specific)